MYIIKTMERGETKLSRNYDYLLFKIFKKVCYNKIVNHPLVNVTGILSY